MIKSQAGADSKVASRGRGFKQNKKLLHKTTTACKKFNKINKHKNNKNI